MSTMPTIEILPTEITEVREKVIAYFTTTNQTDDCLPEDLERIKDDEYQVFRFIYLLKATKGITELDPVVSLMIAGLKRRKEMNVSRLKKEDFPIEFFQCGAFLTCKYFGVFHVVIFNSIKKFIIID